MIRELTKSANSFSWALSLLTLKQGLNLLRPGQQGGGDLFAPMTQVAVGQLDESMKGFFRGGDSMQAGMVDMAFTMLNPLNWLNPSAWQNMDMMNPGNWIASATNLARNTMGSGCGQTRRQPSTTPPPQGSSSGSGSPPAGNVPVSNQSPAAGWGPMP